MADTEPKKPVPLNYSQADGQERHGASSGFWGVYVACGLIGLFVLEPLLAHWLFGRRAMR